MEMESRLSRLCQIVIENTTQNTLQSIARHNLAIYVPDDQIWQASEPFTPDGLNLVMEAISAGTKFVFSKSKIIFPPTIPFKEEILANAISTEAGLPEIRIINNQIDIRSPNYKRAPIKSIVSYLDPLSIRPTPKIVKEIDVAQNGFLFTAQSISKN
jgi:hypothetical protein